jgi:hypothetical protein
MILVNKHTEEIRHICFELAWLKQEGFYDLRVGEWDSVTHGRNALVLWQNKIRHLEKKLRVGQKTLVVFTRKKNVVY